MSLRDFTHQGDPVKPDLVKLERNRLTLPLIEVEIDFHTRTMYKIICVTCGEFGVHESRTGAESRAVQHATETSLSRDALAVKV